MYFAFDCNIIKTISVNKTISHKHESSLLPRNEGDILVLHTFAVVVDSVGFTNRFFVALKRRTHVEYRFV